MASDKAIRGKYLYLVVAQAMAFMRTRPTRQEVETKIDAALACNVDLMVPTEDVFARPGILLGRLMSMAHNIIYSFELRDYRERKAEEAEGTAGI